MPTTTTISSRHYAALLVCGLALICILLGLNDGVAQSWLGYDRSKILDGEIWRLWTCQYVHLNFNHAVENALGLFLVLGVFHVVASLRNMILLLLSSGIIASMGVFIFYPDIITYAGHSGTTHGLFAGGAILLIARKQYRFGALIMFLLLAKLSWEFTVGPVPGVETLLGNRRVLIEGHLFGSIGGFVGALICLAADYNKGPPLTRRSTLP